MAEGTTDEIGEYLARLSVKTGLRNLLSELSCSDLDGSTPSVSYCNTPTLSEGRNGNSLDRLIDKLSIDRLMPDTDLDQNETNNNVDINKRFREADILSEPPYDSDGSDTPLNVMKNLHFADFGLVDGLISNMHDKSDKSGSTTRKSNFRYTNRHSDSCKSKTDSIPVAVEIKSDKNSTLSDSDVKESPSSDDSQSCEISENIGSGNSNTSLLKSKSKGVRGSIEKEENSHAYKSSQSKSVASVGDSIEKSTRESATNSSTSRYSSQYLGRTRIISRRSSVSSARNGKDRISREKSCTTRSRETLSGSRKSSNSKTRKSRSSRLSRDKTQPVRSSSTDENDKNSSGSDLSKALRISSKDLNQHVNKKLKKIRKSKSNSFTADNDFRETILTKNASTQTTHNHSTRDVTADVIAFRYAWQFPSSSNIASKVINRKEIDTLCSPSMLAVHDLTKFHLHLLRKHIDHCKRLYESYGVKDLNMNHKYVTLKDTTEYIERYRPTVISCSD